MKDMKNELKEKCKVSLREHSLGTLLKPYVLTHCGPPNAVSQDPSIKPKSVSIHSIGQTLLKVYSKELPKPASRISVYSESTKQKRSPRQIRNNRQADRCLNLCNPRSRSWDKDLYKEFIWELIPGVLGEEWKKEASQEGCIEVTLWLMKS